MSKNVEVTIQSECKLSGTLTIPNETSTNFPAVLIIMGSGKGDRDGNFKSMKMNIYKDLADFLTEKGFVTLRYDKRGTHQSEGNFLEAGLSDFIDDAVAGVRLLKNHPQVDQEKVLILGHSEGAIIAPAVHEKEPVSGLILLAGAAIPNIDLMPLQNEMAFEEMYKAKGFQGWIYRTLKVPEKARKKNEQIFEKMENTDKAVVRVQGIKMNAKWMRETRQYNICDYLEEVTVPVLAITGDKDVQTPPEHARMIAEMVKGEAEWHVIPEMNHLLRKYDGQHTMLGLMKEYKSLVGQPIDSDLLDKIDSWLEKHFQQQTI